MKRQHSRFFYFIFYFIMVSANIFCIYMYIDMYVFFTSSNVYILIYTVHLIYFKNKTEIGLALLLSSAIQRHGRDKI